MFFAFQKKIIDDNADVDDNDDTGTPAVISRDGNGDEINNDKDDVTNKRRKKNHFLDYSNRFLINF